MMSVMLDVFKSVLYFPGVCLVINHWYFEVLLNPQLTQYVVQIFHYHLNLAKNLIDCNLQLLLSWNYHQIQMSLAKVSKYIRVNIKHNNSINSCWSWFTAADVYNCRVNLEVCQLNWSELNWSDYEWKNLWFIHRNMNKAYWCTIYPLNQVTVDSCVCLAPSHWHWNCQIWGNVTRHSNLKLIPELQ